ncbi:MAG: hypothetical protein DRQ54_01075 [Gammaproteobacteria bacterium]|nr:MAG: hypothetical protein DRQ54_01075 [Gammaproteobacteria bacterium]RLA15703.1 MAG: hypothetical protein DRQ52_01180 [Gammaproteobacteria bacterium]
MGIKLPMLILHRSYHPWLSALFCPSTLNTLSVKFHIRTLGCKMNQLDSARLRAALCSAGHEAVETETEADYAFVNTCTVTAQADRKSRKGANTADRNARQVAVLGCSVRIDAPKWQAALPGALVFADDEEMYRYFDVEADNAQMPLTSRTRLPVAIQTGCDDTCSFCITTLARGAHRSLSIEKITEEIQEAHRQDIKEIVLTGINLAAWGAPDTKHQSQQAQLHKLLQALLVNTSIPRIRLSSLGPQYLRDGFWEVYADPRICDYLHLSVQSGSDPVLKLMDRGHGTAEVINIAEQSRKVRPATALAADFIAGFPAESDAHHQQTLDLVQSVGFSKLHVFPYSAREGTAAARMPGHLPPDMRKARAARLRSLGKTLRQKFIADQIGQTVSVLVEERQLGWSSNYIRLRTDKRAEGSIAQIMLSADTLGEQID